MPKLSDEKLRELLSDKFADFEVDVDRKMWEEVGGKIATPKGVAPRSIRSSLMAVTVGVLVLFLSWPGGDIIDNNNYVITPVVAAPVVATIQLRVEKEKAPSLVEEPEPQITAVAYHSSGSESVINKIPEAGIVVGTFPGMQVSRWIRGGNAVDTRRYNHNAKINFAVGSFANYKQISMNRFDNSFLSGFNSGDAVGLKRFGYQAAASLAIPLSRADFEMGLSYTHYRSSISYSEFTPAYDDVVKKDLNSIYNIVGIRAGYLIPSRYGQMMMGLEWQVMRQSGTFNATHNLLLARVGYSLKVRSWGNTDLVLRPVVSSALTTINMGTMRSRPYTIGVDAVFSRKLKR